MNSTASLPFLAIFIASLLGSPHCAVMCGGFTTLASRSERAGGWLRISWYHLGRLLTYLLGGLGAQQICAYFSPVILGGVLIAVGITSFCKVRILPPRVHRFLTLAYRRVVSFGSPTSALFPFLIGTASTLLPCGWLYLYVGIAATGDVPLLTMSAFWLGTLPILTIWSRSSQLLLRSVGRYVPAAQSILLVIAGVLSILQHTGNPLSEKKSTPCEHHMLTQDANQ